MFSLSALRVQIPQVSVLEGLRSWQGHNKLKQAVLRLLAKELTEVEIQEIRRKFIGLDKNNDGFITKDELMRAMHELRRDSPSLRFDEREVRSLVSALDASGGAQKIGYQEFISALIERRMKFEREQLLEAFKKLDVFGEGKITSQALQAVLKNQGRSNSHCDVVPSEIHEIMEDFAQGANDAITFEDFCRMFNVANDAANDAANDGIT